MNSLVPSIGSTIHKVSQSFLSSKAISLPSSDRIGKDVCFKKETIFKCEALSALVSGDLSSLKATSKLSSL